MRAAVHACCVSPRPLPGSRGWPGAATTAQLPTVVLYDGGKEADRLPRKKANGGVVKGRWTADDVARVFELQQRAGLEAKTAKKRK